MDPQWTLRRRREYRVWVSWSIRTTEAEIEHGIWTREERERRRIGFDGTVVGNGPVNFSRELTKGVRRKRVTSGKRFIFGVLKQYVY